MSSNNSVFPFSALNAFKFNLLNLPYVHKKLKFSYTSEILEENGDFLIQHYDDESLLLSVRAVKRVLEFPVLICECHESGLIGFEFCDEQFTSLPELISEFSMPSGYFRTNEGEKIRLGRPVFRNQYSGRFGYGEVVKLQKDEYTTTNVFIRSLRPCFTSMNDVQVELEKLIDLKCRHLVAFQDFQVYEVGHKIPPIILARYTWYEGNLFDYLKNLKYPMGTSKYILWCYQAGKALSYLSGLGFFHRRLCPRACQLDFNENLKISDYWTDKDIEDTPLFQKIDTTNPLSENLGMHRDGWRFLPPETILSNLFTSSSQVWNYALLIWQIFTHCRFANRIHYASLADFLAAKLEDDPFYMPGALSRTEANQGLPERRRRMLAFYKACEKFPSSPKAFNYMIPKCLKKNPDERSTWTELFSVVDAEYRISKLSFSLSKVI